MHNLENLCRTLSGAHPSKCFQCRTLTQLCMSAFSYTTVPFNISVTSSKSLNACITTLFVVPSATKLTSLSLSSDGDSGIVLTVGGLLGFVVVAWLHTGKLRVGYSSRHSFHFAAETKWSLQILGLVFIGKFSHPILCIHVWVILYYGAAVQNMND